MDKLIGSLVLFCFPIGCCRALLFPLFFYCSVEGDTDKEIHAKFDLKGSSLGRLAKEGEKVLKDLDLVKYGKIHLGSQRTAFLKVNLPECNR